MSNGPARDLWSNGKVGINGVSYYAINQWTVGALKPPHLAALCIWEGSSDYYRELCRHGGILSDFFNSWHPRQVGSVQHGLGDRGAKSVVTGEAVAGPDTLSAAELASNCANSPGEAKRRRLSDDYHAARTADLSQIEAPLLSAANWGGMGLHTRGNFEGYLAAGTKQKWLKVPRRHPFHALLQQLRRNLAEAVLRTFSQRRGYRLERQPRVTLNVRHPGEKFVLRSESEWPLARTRWTQYFLQPEGFALTPEQPATTTTLTYDTTGDGLIFRTPPRDTSFEITGPVAAKLWVSSPTIDADLFLALRLSIPPAKRSPSSVPTIRAYRSDSAGCALRIASSIRQDRCPTGPGTATTRNGRCGPVDR